MQQQRAGLDAEMRFSTASREFLGFENGRSGLVDDENTIRLEVKVGRVLPGFQRWNWLLVQGHQRPAVFDVEAGWNESRFIDPRIGREAELITLLIQIRLEFAKGREGLARLIFPEQF